MVNIRWRKAAALVLAVTMASTVTPTGMFGTENQIYSELVIAATTKPVEETSGLTTVVSEEVFGASGLSVRVDWSTMKALISKSDGLKTDDIFYYQFVNDKNGSKQKPVSSKWNTVVVDRLQVQSVTAAGVGASTSETCYVLDLSALSLGKAQTLYLTTDIEDEELEPVEYHIEAQPSKLKINLMGEAPASGIIYQDFVGDDIIGYLSIDKSKTDTAAQDFKNIEWKIDKRSWRSVVEEDGSGGRYSTMKLSDYMNKGTTLQLRQKASEGTPPGKVVTVKYSARAKGPKVVVDNVKQSVVFPKGSEYIEASDYNRNVTWTKVSQKNSKYFDEFTGYDGSRDLELYVRTSANGKKLTSKVTIVTLEAKEGTSPAVSAVSGASAFALTGDIAVSLVDASNYTKGISFANNTSEDYQIAIVKNDLLTDKDLQKGSVLKIGDKSGALFSFADVKAGKTKKISKIGASWKDKITSEEMLRGYTLLVRGKPTLAPRILYTFSFGIGSANSIEEYLDPATAYVNVQSEHYQEAEESSIDPAILEWNYDQSEVMVPYGNNSIIYYNFTNKEKEPKDWENWYKMDCYFKTPDGSGPSYAGIDFSSLNTSKDNWIYIKGDKDTKPLVVKLAKVATVKVNFVANSKKLTEGEKNYVDMYTKFTDETGYYTFTQDGSLVTDGNRIRWKLENGDWASLSNLNLSDYKYNGAKLYFKVNNDGAASSKIVSAKYKARAKAKQVAIDGDKLTVALTNTLEYRVKVGSGQFGSWTSVATSGKVSLGELENMVGNGNGISSQWRDTTLMLRVAGTEKKLPSNASIVKIYAPDEPECGSDGLSVDLANATKPEKGMKFTNKTSVAYQVAMIEGGTNVEQAIAGLNYKAKAKESGYIKFTTVKAGKSATISYKTYKSFTNPTAICRIATIKENKKTQATEFRIASLVQAVNGGRPTCNLPSGVVTIEGEQSSVTRSIEYSIANGWTVYYTLDGSKPKVENDTITGNKYTGPFDVTIENNKQLTLCALGVKLDADGKVVKVGDYATTVLTGYKVGDTSTYASRWGYKLCEDEASKSLYSMVYDAVVSYKASIDLTSAGWRVSDTNKLLSIVDRVRYDNPQLLQMKGGISYSHNGTNILKLTLSYNQDKDTTSSMMSEVEATYQNIVELAKSSSYGGNQDFSQITDPMKVKAIHDYLITHNQYHSSNHDQDIYGAMSIDSSPVCMSYAMSFLYCCQRMGIECVLVTGYAGEAHAWNLVRLDNGNNTDDSDDWYEMDVTWDDPVGGIESYIGTTYFNVTTAQLNQKKTRTRSTNVYSRYPIENATGTLYGATNMYSLPFGTGTTMESSTTVNLSEYRCGLELPTAVGEMVE